MYSRVVIRQCLLGYCAFLRLSNVPYYGHERDAFSAARPGCSRSRSVEGDDLFAARRVALASELDRTFEAADREAADREAAEDVVRARFREGRAPDRATGPLQLAIFGVG